MTLTFNDGTQYGSMLDIYANNPIMHEEGDSQDQPAKTPIGAVKKERGIDAGSQEEYYPSPKKEFQNDDTTPGTGERGSFNVDRNHHVPLVASGILDQDRNMVGLAIDHRVPPNPEYEPFLALHEGTEISYMKDLIDDGMSPQDAYHKAHDHATARESAAVRAHAARNGADPDAYLDSYKQFWRDAASVAREPTHVGVHPDAHTTRYGLDAAELPDLKINPDTEDPASIKAEHSGTAERTHINIQQRFPKEYFNPNNVGTPVNPGTPTWNPQQQKWTGAVISENDLPEDRQRPVLQVDPRTSTYNAGEPWTKVMVPGYGMRYVKQKNLWKYQGQKDEDFGEPTKMSPWEKDEQGNWTRRSTSMEGETDAPLHNKPLNIDVIGANTMLVNAHQGMLPSKFAAHPDFVKDLAEGERVSQHLQKATLNMKTRAPANDEGPGKEEEFWNKLLDDPEGTLNPKLPPEWEEAATKANNGKELKGYERMMIMRELEHLTPEQRKYELALWKQKESNRSKDKQKNFKVIEGGPRKSWADQLRSYFGLDKDD